MIAIIALGSNLGDRRAHLDAALVGLGELGTLTASPLVMESVDESGVGPSFLNTVARLEVPGRDFRRLLEALLRLEVRLGRVRSEGRNQPRTVDLDLIAVDGRTGSWNWETPADLVAPLGPWLTLDLPHPRAEVRDFVLKPWQALG